MEICSGGTKRVQGVHNAVLVRRNGAVLRRELRFRGCLLAILAPAR